MLPIKEKLESKVERTATCWLWHGNRATKNGYGRIWNKTHVLVHRLSYEIYKGPIPEGMKVCHKCDVPNCVNPDHLFLGTQKENVQDSVKKGRAIRAKGEKCGASKITAEQALKIRAAARAMIWIAKDHGISNSQVWNIKHFKHWRHV